MSEVPSATFNRFFYECSHQVSLLGYRDSLAAAEHTKAIISYSASNSSLILLDISQLLLYSVTPKHFFLELYPLEFHFDK